MSNVEVTCFWCGVKFSRRFADVSRYLKSGRDRFYCSSSCSAKKGNSERPDTSVAVEKTCPQCSRKFMSNTKKKAATFCSRGCASKGSVTEYRRERAREVGRTVCRNGFSIQKIAKGLRTREWYKYTKIDAYMSDKGIEHQLEFPLGSYVYDLAIIPNKIIVEFDGPEHSENYTIPKDNVKQTFAEDRGWKVFRIYVGKKSVIDPESIRHIVSLYEKTN